MSSLKPLHGVVKQWLKDAHERGEDPSHTYLAQKLVRKFGALVNQTTAHSVVSEVLKAAA